MTAIILDKSKAEISRHKQSWLLILCVAFNLLTVGFSFWLLNGAVQEKSALFLSMEIHENFVEDVNDSIAELREQLSNLSAYFEDYREDVEDMVTKVAEKFSTLWYLQKLMQDVEEEELETLKSSVTEFKNDSQNQFESLQNRTLSLERERQDTTNLEKLVKKLNESTTAMNATIADLKQVAYSQIDTIYVLINELVAKSNWLQDKIDS